MRQNEAETRDITQCPDDEETGPQKERGSWPPSLKRPCKRTGSGSNPLTGSTNSRLGSARLRSERTPGAVVAGADTGSPVRVGGDGGAVAASGVLGPVHGGVRRGEDCGQAARPRAGGGPDGGGHGDSDAGAGQHGRPSEQRGEVRGLRRGEGPSSDGGELVAAEPAASAAADPVGPAAQPRCGDGEQLVAGGVAVGV